MIFFRFFLIAFTAIIISTSITKATIKTAEYIQITPEKYTTNLFHGIIKSAQSATLSFQSEGKITFFPYTKGDFIRRGQVIARLDGILYQIKKNEEQARLKEATIQYEKQKSYNL